MSITITRECRVAMLTFGGQQFYTMAVGEKFTYGDIVETNGSFTVFKNGLNFYVFETTSYTKDQ